MPKRGVYLHDIPPDEARAHVITPLLSVLYDDAFRAAVASLPGYEVGEMGTVQERR